MVAWVNGHTHRNEITAHKRADGSGGFWEINTAAHIDYPQQARMVEVADNSDKTLSIFTTIIDHAGPADYRGDLSTTVGLASLARELSVNDPQAKLGATGWPRTATPSCWCASRPTWPERYGWRAQSALTWSRNVSRLVCSAKMRSASTAGSFSSSPSMILPPMISWPT